MLAHYYKATVLDVGGGHGQLVEPLIRNGYKVTVLGSSEKCKNRINRFVENNLCEFRAGDILNIPYNDREFDIVISFRQIPHVKNWKRFVSELTRVSRKAVIVDFPSVRSLNYIDHIIPIFLNLRKDLNQIRELITFSGSLNWSGCSGKMDLFTLRGIRSFFLPMFLHRKLKLYSVSEALENIFRLFGITGILGSPVILKLVREGL